MLNNAVAMARRPAGWSDGIPDSRLSDLRRFAEAVLDTLKDLFNQEVLRGEEAVFALLCLAQFTHMQHVVGSHKMPMGVVSAETLAAVKKLLDRKNVS